MATLAGARADCAPGAPDGGVDAFAEALLGGLLPLCGAASRPARTRAVQLCGLVLASLRDDVELDGALLQRLEDALVERLRDRHPAARAEAARALARLQARRQPQRPAAHAPAHPSPVPQCPGDDGEADRVTAELLQARGVRVEGRTAACTRRPASRPRPRIFASLPCAEPARQALSCDKHKEVRRAVLHSLAPSAPALPFLVQRTRDVSEDVRRATFLALANKVPLQSLSIAQRATLLHRGLADRAPPVRAAALVMLGKWMAGARVWRRAGSAASWRPHCARPGGSVRQRRAAPAGRAGRGGARGGGGDAAAAAHRG